MSYDFYKYYFKCDLCDRAFSSKSALQRHKQNKNINCNNFSYTYNINCADCKKIFKDTYAFKKHCQEKHNKNINFDKQFECTFCNKKFSSNNTLKRHCKTTCKVIKQRKKNIEEYPLNDFISDNHLLENNFITKIINKHKDYSQLVEHTLDNIFKNSKNFNIYKLNNNNQVSIFTKNKWIKETKKNAYNKIIDSILDKIEEYDLNPFYESMVNKYNKISNLDNTQFKRVYLYSYIDNILQTLQEDNKINFY